METDPFPANLCWIVKSDVIKRFDCMYGKIDQFKIGLNKVLTFGKCLVILLSIFVVYWFMGLVVRKPVFRVYVKVSFKPVSSATETS